MPFIKASNRNQASLPIFNGVFERRLIVHLFRNTIKRLCSKHHRFFLIVHVERNESPSKELEITRVTRSNDWCGEVIKSIFVITVKAVISKTHQSFQMILQF